MIEVKYFWINVLFLAVGTFLIRFVLIGFSSRIKISSRVRAVFTYMPVSILPAFIAPAVFLHQGQVDWLLGKERFLALLLSTVVCFYSRSTLATVSFGLLTLYFLRL